MYCLCVVGFGGDECIVCVLQGLVVMSVLFVCYRVIWRRW